MNMLLEQATMNYENGHLDRALENVDKLLHKDTQSRDALLLKSNILFKRGMRIEAVNVLKGAKELHPNDKEILLTLGYQMLNPEDAERSLTYFCDVIDLYGKDPESMIGMGKALKLIGRPNEALLTFERALEILYPSNYLSPTTEFGESVLPSVTIDHKYTFSRLFYAGNPTVGASLIGKSVDQKYFIKISIKAHPEKSNSLLEEFAIMRQLNDIGCVSCPRAYKFGIISGEYLSTIIDAETSAKLGDINKLKLRYLIQQNIPSNAMSPLPDLILAIVEQKACGIYHGDIRPENIRFNSKNGICFLIDYDQAIHITPKEQKMGNTEFFKWVNEWTRKRYAKWKFPHFMAYFQNFNFERDFWPHFKNGALDLARTRLFSNQITTASKQGIYHTLHERDIYIEGERDLKTRKSLLDQIVFKPGERVLDVGCSSGILSMYLSSRGCSVTGIELDPEVLCGAKMVANILFHQIDYQNVDLDDGTPLGIFDTIMLFSVIHHTKNMKENAARIAGACKRIIIECRLQEGGMKPENGEWQRASGWNFPDLESMYRGLEKLFPGFRFSRNFGQGDRSRYILEFLRIN